jgi:hypothetical protein
VSVLAGGADSNRFLDNRVLVGGAIGVEGEHVKEKRERALRTVMVKVISKNYFEVPGFVRQGNKAYSSWAGGEERSADWSGRQ